ncbi:MAG: hypothetical protein GTO14_05670 [Anaerolineales bacterium]|nr:hypothetical protein [Anaerolineales bacterium]
MVLIFPFQTVHDGLHLLSSTSAVSTSTPKSCATNPWRKQCDQEEAEFDPLNWLTERWEIDPAILPMEDPHDQGTNAGMAIPWGESAASIPLVDC